MSNAIFILSGPVQTGKTTLLKSNIHDKKVCGILQPLVDGKRTFLNLQSGFSIPMEAENQLDASQTISVGKYHFIKNAFEWAKNGLISSIKDNPEWIIIDEVGKLEILQNKGLEPAVAQIIAMCQEKKINSNLILVIRDSLLNNAIVKYSLQNANIINVEELRNEPHHFFF